MCYSRRSHRIPNTFALPIAVRHVCQSLREQLPALIPQTEKDLLRFLLALRHVERRPVTDTRRGRALVGDVKTC